MSKSTLIIAVNASFIGFKVDIYNELAQKFLLLSNLSYNMI